VQYTKVCVVHYDHNYTSIRQEVEISTDGIYLSAKITDKSIIVWKTRS
jgi:hypothetical protein